MARGALHEPIRVATPTVSLDGDLRIPLAATGLVIFADGSGSSRFSSRNRAVAGAFEGHGFATLLMDLLTQQEESIDNQTAEYRFDIDLLGRRVVSATDWVQSQPELHHLRVAYFGASTGAAAALIAAAERPDRVRAVISRGGRPDLANDALPRVQTPTLLIVGGDDAPVIDMNREAMHRMRAPVKLEIVPRATHLFQEPGALERVADLAVEWCQQHITAKAV